MSRHLVWLVLAVSVIFNLGFAASYLTARSAPAGDVTTPADGATGDPATGGESAGARSDGPRDGRPGRERRGGMESRLRQVAGMLDLDEDQMAYFQGLHTGMGEDDRIFAFAIDAVRGSLAEAYEADADVSTVQLLHEREAELLRQRRLARSERLDAFMAVLEPDQLTKFRGMIESRSRGENPETRNRMARYDTDGDGHLGVAEIEALRAEIDDRIRRRTEAMIESQRALRERFDADGDGRLDRAEREAARAWQIMRRFDTNGDGELDADERAAYEAAREEMGRRMGRNRDRRGGGPGPGAGPGAGPDSGPGPRPGQGRGPGAGNGTRGAIPGDSGRRR